MLLSKSKIGILVLAFAVANLGCDDVTKESQKTYYYEAHLITTAQCDSFTMSITPGHKYSFSQIKNFRTTLKNYGGQFLGSDSELSESELKTVMHQYGIDNSEYTEVKSSLDPVENLIIFAEYAPDLSNYVIWMYIERE